MADTAAIRAGLLEGARLFNQGQYFEAHERLEEALDHVTDDLWDLFVGLIQIAVGYHKVTQRLWSGAAGMLDRGLAKLASCDDDAGGVKLAALRERVTGDIARLRQESFDPALFAREPPRLQFEPRQSS